MSVRFRVDLDEDGSSYASYSEEDYGKAVELFNERGVRLLRCRDIHDRGIPLLGPPIVHDMTRRTWDEN